MRSECKSGGSVGIPTPAVFELTPTLAKIGLINEDLLWTITPGNTV